MMIFKANLAQLIFLPIFQQNFCGVASRNFEGVCGCAIIFGMRIDCSPTEVLQQSRKMWTEARKSYRSPQKSTSQPQRLSTTCLLTSGKADKPSVRQPPRQCPLHFNEPSHVCLTCRKSICLRCALTYCQQHAIRTEVEVLHSLREELLRLEVGPKLEELEVKLKQSKQRQEYLQKKVLRMIEGIESHFDYISEMLSKKKLQIIQYYDQQFQRYLEQHRHYDQQMRNRMDWLRNYTFDDDVRLATIEQIDQLSAQIKKSSVQDAKLQKRVTRMLMGKDKIRTQKLWNEENLQRVLYEIENIPFKNEEKVKTEKRKKRITTENANQHITIANIKSSSNSRFPSSRKQHTPS